MTHHRRRKSRRTGHAWRLAPPTAPQPRVKRDRQLGLEHLEPRLVLTPIISEFLASNTDTVHGLRDYQGTLQDWIEIYNPDTQPVDLTGWKLKDSGSTWTFPSLTLGPGEFRIVFASGNDLTTPELHTNFKLSRDPGEYLGLLDNLGHVVHEYQPSYPSQENNISYGIGQNIEETKLVSAGADTRYFVPTNAVARSRRGCSASFNDASWAHGPTGLGFANLVPGFAVWNYKASIAVSDLAVAQTVISTPSYQTAVYTRNGQRGELRGHGRRRPLRARQSFPRHAHGYGPRRFRGAGQGDSAHPHHRRLDLRCQQRRRFPAEDHRRHVQCRLRPVGHDRKRRHAGVLLTARPGRFVRGHQQPGRR